MGYPMVVIHFSPLKSGQPLYSGQINSFQCVLYTEVSLYSVTVASYYDNPSEGNCEQYQPQ